MAGVCGIYEALWLARLHVGSAHALYLHLPFCARKCLYCDFSSWATKASDPVIGSYGAALQGLVHQAADAGLLDGCVTAYVGGGTPTFAGDGLVELVRQVRAALPRIEEFTCEANPDSLSDALLAGLADAGCTRLSVGIQSTDDQELRLLGRIHTAAQATDRLRVAVSTGLDVSADLMCAIPGQTDESWRRSLADVLDCGVSHVSVYPLQIEEGTPFDESYGEVDPVWHDSEIQARRMEVAQQVLEARGLSRYEVASYAAAGKACRHNQAYWTATPYLGLGTDASSMLTREGYERLRTIAPQLPAPAPGVQRVRLTCTDGRHELARAQSFSDLHFYVETLDEAQAAAEDLMLAMRMTEGAGAGLVAHARACLGEVAVDEALSWCLARGLVERRGQAWAPTAYGWLLGNSLYGRLWDLAPGAVGTFEV